MERDAGARSTHSAVAVRKEDSFEQVVADEAHSSLTSQGHELLVVEVAAPDSVLRILPMATSGAANGHIPADSVAIQDRSSQYWSEIVEVAMEVQAAALEAVVWDQASS